MNITPVFLEAKIYGTFDVINNQSEGLIKLFHHKKIDLALNPMRLSMDRSYVVDIVVIGSDEVKGSTLRNISMMNSSGFFSNSNSGRRFDFLHKMNEFIIGGDHTIFSWCQGLEIF